MKQEASSAFEKAAERKPGGGLAAEFWEFLRANKKWWLLPMVVIFAVLAALILLSSTGAAPFIYTLF
jgi:Family of unknown function (DUF5989)